MGTADTFENPVFETLGRVYDTLERQFSVLQQRYSHQMQCAQGCSGCCIDGFKIRPAEALFLLEGFSKAPPAVVQQILDNLEKPQEASQVPGMSKCPLLINDACSLYTHRPALCRAFGVLLKLDETVSTCELNFQDPSDARYWEALDLRPYYDVLDELSTQVLQAAGQISESTQAGSTERPNVHGMMSIRTLLRQFLVHQFSESTACEQKVAPETPMQR